MWPAPPLDDAHAMAVYADALQEAGDPRGQLIQLQLACEAAPKDVRLARAAEQHLHLNARALLGGLRTLTSLCLLTWRRGFIVSAVVQSQALAREFVLGRYVDVEVARPKVVKAVRALLELDSARTLTSLVVTMPWSNTARALMLASADEVAAKRGALERVVFTFFDEVDQNDVFQPVPSQATFGSLVVHADAALAADVFARFADR